MTSLLSACARIFIWAASHAGLSYSLSMADTACVSAAAHARHNTRRDAINVTHKRLCPNVRIAMDQLSAHICYTA